MLVDTHCHLYFDKFGADRGEVVSRMQAAGVGGAVVIGIDDESNEAACGLASQHNCLEYSVGLHPTSKFPARFDPEECFRCYFEKSKQPVAIGECGIDLHWDTNPLAKQKQVLEAQLAYAKSRNLPAVIHTRNADQETQAVLADFKEITGILHCFNGSPLLLDFAVDNGWYVSFAGNLTYPRAVELHRCAPLVPLDRLLLETDSPFLAPQPVRGKRCEPSFVVYTAQKLAELRGMSLDELSPILFENSKRCFGVNWVLP